MARGCLIDFQAKASRSPQSEQLLSQCLFILPQGIVVLQLALMLAFAKAAIIPGTLSRASNTGAKRATVSSYVKRTEWQRTAVENMVGTAPQVFTSSSPPRGSLFYSLLSSPSSRTSLFYGLGVSIGLRIHFR